MLHKINHAFYDINGQILPYFDVKFDVKIEYKNRPESNMLPGLFYP